MSTVILRQASGPVVLRSGDKTPVRVEARPISLTVQGGGRPGTPGKDAEPAQAIIPPVIDGGFF